MTERPRRGTRAANAFAVVRGWLNKCVAALTRSGPERNAVFLVVKAALATVLAWQFAVRVLDSPTPFYAPMAALLVVDRTMVRSLSASVQRIAAVVLGMGVAWLVGTWLGVHWWSVGPVLVLALVIARWSRLGDHGVQVPTMVLMSLLTVGGTDVDFTYLTILQTVAGGAIGVAINFLVLAPLHVSRPRELVAQLTTEVADLLDEITTGLRTEWNLDTATGWYHRGIAISDRAPVVVQEISIGQESTKLNPRHKIRRVEVDWAGYAASVEALRSLQFRVAGIARTLADAADDQARMPPPPPEFVQPYVGALEAISATVRVMGRRDEKSTATFEANLTRAEQILTDLLVRERRSPPPDPTAWTSYGALISDAQRCCRVLALSRDRATVPSSSGPIRQPVLESLPVPQIRRGRRRT